MGRQRRGEVVGIGTVVGWCSSSHRRLVVVVGEEESSREGGGEWV